MIHLILGPQGHIQVLNQAAGAVLVQMDGLIGPASAGGPALARFHVPAPNVLAVAQALRESKEWRSPVQIRGPILAPAGAEAGILQATECEVAGLTVSRPGGWHEGILCVSLVPADPRFDRLIADLETAHSAVAA